MGIPKHTLKRCIYLLVPLWSYSLNSYGQIVYPQTPTVQPFQPITIGRGYPATQNYGYNPTPQSSGYTANDIMEQSRRQAMQTTGVYINNPNYTLEQNRQAMQAYQMQQLQNQAGYKNQSAENDFSPTNRQMKLEREMVELLKESGRNNAIVTEKDYYNSPEYRNDLPNYVRAKELIKEMLDGKRDLSIKDAYYFTESAYGNVPFTYSEYNKLIQANAAFIRHWLKENHYPLNDPEAIQFGIQKFVSDTLFITVNGKKQGHCPYYYDYIDVLSEKDRRNYFVTKTFATGGGQCHTLPLVYIILAEALNVETYIAYNYQHSFIQYKNNNGMVLNYETTIDRFLPDAFYTEVLPAMAKAQRNSLYVSSLSKRQVVASVLYDLAGNFMLEHWLSDKTFINECISIAAPYFHSKELMNTTHNYIQKRLYAEAFNDKVQERHIQDMSEIEKFPDVLEAYRNYYNYMEKSRQSGIQDFPENAYVQLLEYYDQKGRLQVAKKIDAKTKKTLFIE